ncbi:hypothetical protein L3Y34_013839 [Caenorhabditis briggsae]|uniref:Uncharacterized protein n=1 Tax=Caenorhabditis briggsae TaxID=6238 RepID=A0AAE8ZZE4_CAEBR|nr:hypothetical protein L3Y34_013839 [Caenorhabditis briggsae]
MKPPLRPESHQTHDKLHRGARERIEKKQLSFASIPVTAPQIQRCSEFNPQNSHILECTPHTIPKDHFRRIASICRSSKQHVFWIRLVTTPNSPI